MNFVICINNYDSSDPSTVLRNKIALSSIFNAISSYQNIKIIVTGVPLDYYNIVNISLPRTAKAVGINRDVPFVKDILTVLDQNSNDDSYVGYFNRDLILKPHFFEGIKSILEQGYDSISLMHEELVYNGKNPPIHIKNLLDALKYEENTPYVGRDGFIFKKNLIKHFKDFPDFLIGEISWDICFYDVLLRNAFLYDDCIRPTLTRHMSHARSWDKSSSPGLKYNEQQMKKYYTTEQYGNIVTLLRICEIAAQTPEIDSNFDREIYFYNEYYTGDCLFQIHFLRKLIQSNPNLRCIFYIDPQKVSIEDLNKFIGAPFKHKIILDTGVKNPKAINCWINYNNYSKNDPACWNNNVFYVKFFQMLSKELGLESPIQNSDDILIDHEEILRNNKLSKPYDYLIINEIPQSSQLDYNEEAFKKYVMHLREKGYSCITTQKISNKIPCTLEHNLSLLDIGNISLFATNIIGIHTAALYCTFNKWNQAKERHWGILDKNNTFTFNNRIRLFHSMEELLKEEIIPCPPTPLPRPLVIPFHARKQSSGPLPQPIYTQPRPISPYTPKKITPLVQGHPY
jgi:hypothetical protein